MTATCTHPGCAILLISSPGEQLKVLTCWRHTRSKVPENETTAERWRRITRAT